MTYEKAVELASRDEAFMATVYAMNTLLINKGIYTKQEYRQLFVEWVEKEERKKARESEATTLRGIALQWRSRVDIVHRRILAVRSSATVIATVTELAFTDASRRGMNSLAK
jgi:hypothetical protein